MQCHNFKAIGKELSEIIDFEQTDLHGYSYSRYNFLYFNLDSVFYKLSRLLQLLKQLQYKKFFQQQGYL